MLKNRLKRKDESGIALVELVIAAAIILVILVATAQAFSAAFSTSVLAGNRNQAIQFAQEISSIARQAPFERIALMNPADRDEDLPSQCSENWTGSYEGLPVLTQDTEYPGLVYCQIREITGTDQVFVIYTNITQVPTSGFDNATLNVDTTGTSYVPRRVTVTVTWFNKITLDASTEFDELTMSYIRTPNMAECIPPGVNTSSNNPAACSYLPTGSLSISSNSPSIVQWLNISSLVEEWFRTDELATVGGGK